jgi:hypothetical protein
MYARACITVESNWAAAHRVTNNKREGQKQKLAGERKELGTGVYFCKALFG